MTNLLVKLFIKNYKQKNDNNVRTAYGVLASVVGVICNILLFVIKVVVGIASGSIAVVADAFNNLSDAFSSVIAFIGVKMANRPADKEHPFGHGRSEYIAAFIVACLVIEVGITFVRNSWDRILQPAKIIFSPVSLGILCISVLVKVWLSLFNKKLGILINSSVMRATSADAMGDALTTLATIVSLLISGIFHINIDGYVGMAVAIVVIIAGVNIAKDTIKPLLGERPNKETYQMLTNMVESYEGIAGSHDLIVHNYGPAHSMATIHAEVPNDMDMEAAHELIDQIERDVTKKTGIFLVIHTDPIEISDEIVLKHKEKVFSIIQAIDSGVSAHDFRMVDGEHRINLIFDLVVPYSYNEEMKNQLLDGIMEAVKGYDARCECVITVEHSYVEGNE